MKLAGVLILLVFSSVLLAEHPLFCENAVKDFGIVEEGQKLSYAFVLTNISSAKVQVDRIISSCGCMVTSKKEFTLMPDESTDIIVDFNSFGNGGMSIEKTVAICIKNDEYPPIVLAIKAKIKGIPLEKRVLITPNEKIIENDPNKKGLFLLQVPDESNVSFTISTPNWINYSLHKSERTNLQNVELWEIEISPKNKLFEKVSGELIINSNVPLFEKIKVPVEVFIKPAFVVTPYLIAFDKNKQEQIETVFIKSGDCQIEPLYNSIEVKPSKECIKVNKDVNMPVKEIKLEIINEHCDSSPANIEILLNHKKVGIIPIIFK